MWYFDFRAQLDWRHQTFNTRTSDKWVKPMIWQSTFRSIRTEKVTRATLEHKIHTPLSYSLVFLSDGRSRSSPAYCSTHHCWYSYFSKWGRYKVAARQSQGIPVYLGGRSGDRPYQRGWKLQCQSRRRAWISHPRHISGWWPVPQSMDFPLIHYWSWPLCFWRCAWYVFTLPDCHVIYIRLAEIYYFKPVPYIAYFQGISLWSSFQIPLFVSLIFLAIISYIMGVAMETFIPRWGFFRYLNPVRFHDPPIT